MSGEIVSSIASAGFAVFGGDILEGTKPHLKHTLDNWHCDLERGESWATFVTRSCASAVSYLSKLQHRGQLFFTVVVSEKPSAAQLAASYDR
jgi:hypothetical protein